MTDNIQKLYEIAGVDYEERYNNYTLNKEGECRFKGSCDICEYVEERYIYPTFTAEKHIEIIKFLIGKHASFDIFKNYEQKDLYMVHYECRYFPKQYLPFGEALAESINYLWQSLTEKEKKQIKEILE